MRSVLRALVLLALVHSASLAHASSPNRDVLALQEAIEQVIAQAEPAIACILVSRSDAYSKLGQGPPSDTPGSLGGFEPGFRNFRDEDRTRAERALDLSDPATVPESYGSGLVIRPSGLVLTCAHVVRNATKIYVRVAGGKGSYADIQALDPRSDLAVLRLLNPPGKLQVVSFGDGSSVRKGQFVIGLANPYRSGQRDGGPSASWGIVSNLARKAPGVITETDRTLQSFHRYGTLLQTDVRMSPGCSGGALLDLNGKVVGITSALAALTGIDAPGGFALPIDTRMRDIIDVLARGEEVEYGFLGVTLSPGPRTRAGEGALIGEAIRNGPGWHAGMEQNDLVIAINGNVVHDNDDLFLQIGSLTVGSEVVLDVIRRTSHITLPPVKLAKLYVLQPSLASRRPPALAGLRVDYGSLLSQRTLGMPIPDAVIIREIVPDSPASKNNLLRLDQLITQVNGTPVKTPSAFYEAMRQSPKRVELTVLNSRHQEETVTLEMQ